MKKLAISFDIDWNELHSTVLQYIRGPCFQQGFQNQTFHGTPGIRIQRLTKGKYNDLHYYFLP